MSEDHRPSPSKGSFLILSPIVGWYAIAPFVLMIAGHLLGLSDIAMVAVSGLSILALVSIPARLLIDHAGMKVTWLGRRLETPWREVATVTQLWSMGVWVKLKSGRGLFLVRPVSSRRRVLELRDAILERLESFRRVGSV